MSSIGTARGGKTYEERQLANKVRNLTLTEMEKILTGRNKELRNALILRLATTILPRINQIEGVEGEPFEIIIKKK